MRRLLGTLVGFLALVGASIFHYLVEPYNPGALQFPLLTAGHVILGGIYLALAPLQFVQGIRTTTQQSTTTFNLGRMTLPLVDDYALAIDR